MVSFPPRIKYGVNSSGNPECREKIWTPAFAGVTGLFNPWFFLDFQTANIDTDK